MTCRNTTVRILWCVAVLAACSAARAQDFGAWRALTAEEDKARVGDAPAQSVDPSAIEADFDGDGRTDKALIAVRKADRVEDLIVDLGRRIEVLVRSEKGGEGIAPGAGLGLARPGRWETVCGNAFRDLQGGMCESERYPRAVTLKRPGIVFVTDGETLLYYWSPGKKTFDSVVLRN